jgi:phosphoenolpyruvate---glycerone phosphotransferase subunit DhaM
LVSLVLVSHSRKLAEGLQEMVEQVAGPGVRVTVAGGTADGRLGTSAPAITAAIRMVDDGHGVLVLIDLGSAALSADLALEDLEPAQRERVRISPAPFVEGAILAAVEATLGSDLDAVAAAAARAFDLPKLPQD